MNKTREKILLIATEIFVEKGFAGTKMRDISEKANINKGLLHYYFKTKNQLFMEILESTVRGFAPKVDAILRKEVSIFEKIELYVDKYIDLLCNNRHFPYFIINEINTNTDVFVDFILNIEEIKKLKVANRLLQIQLELDELGVKGITSYDLLLNIVSLSIMPFMARPGIQKILEISDAQFFDYMQNRKKIIVHTILSSIKAKQ